MPLPAGSEKGRQFDRWWAPNRSVETASDLRQANRAASFYGRSARTSPYGAPAAIATIDRASLMGTGPLLALEKRAITEGERTDQPTG
jgi:hypothetical protein